MPIPYQPLPEAVHDQMQRELEVVRFLFAETVAAGRGDRLTHDAALATEAAVFRGADAIAAGLADELADPVTAFRAFAAAPRGTTSTSRKGPEMTTKPTDTQTDTPPNRYWQLAHRGRSADPARATGHRRSACGGILRPLHARE